MKTLYLDGNDWTFRWEGRTYSRTTGQMELDDTLTPTGMFVAASGSNTAIDATLSKTLTLRLAGTGDYDATVLGTDITTKLATYVNTVIYEVLRVGTNYRIETPVRVKLVRGPDDT